MTLPNSERAKRTLLCLVLIAALLFLASCGIVSTESDATEEPEYRPDRTKQRTTDAEPYTATPDWTTDDATYPDTDVKCWFEVKETGVSPLPGVTRAYVADGGTATNGSTYPQYTFLHVETSEPDGLTFLGWSLGKPLRDGEEPLSTDLGYSFRLFESPTYLYANFKNLYPAETTVTYHLNGGTSDAGETFVRTVDTSYFTAPNTLYNAGGFVREGFVLLEYNTEPDGTGDAYSPGEKANAVDGRLDLYCIWAPVSSGFETANETVNYGEKDRWGRYPYSYSGVSITGYTGDDETLVIPEKIDGKEVVSIKAGAFQNKSFTTLVLPRTLRKIEDGAFIGCSNLKTLYMGDGILSISNAAFDSATYENWSEFRLFSTTAPRFASSYDGGYRVKWDRLMRGVASGKKLVVFVSGSSSLHGISTDYLDRLLGDEYFVVEYGTVRTTNNMVYTEAVAHFLEEGDTVIYAPENSIYQFGCPAITFRLFRDLESSQNVWRYIDVRNYENLFGAFQEYQDARWARKAETYTDHPTYYDKNGDFQNEKHADYCEDYAPDFQNNHGYFTVTLNDKVNSVSTVTQQISLSNPDQWVDIGTYASDVRRVLDKVRATGAQVFFGFCPVNENALTEEAKTKEQQAAFDALVSETFGIELLGSCSDHIYRWQYMYKGSDGSDFHLNDYGRAINTYKVYLRLCEKNGIAPVGMKRYGEDFSGCLFE